MDSLNIPRAPKLPSDLSELVGFESTVESYNGFARRLSAAETPEPCETVRPGRR